MKKMISTVALALSFFACANLLVPDVLRAGMMTSRFQSEQDIETIRKKLSSKEILSELRKFGYSNEEALQIRDVITDANVLSSLADLGNPGNGTGRIRADKIRLDRVQETLAQSVEKCVDENLREKIRHRGEKLVDLKTENLVASKLSGDSAGKTDAVRMSNARKTITCETLMAMGMGETDAREIVGRLNGDDLESVIRGDVEIAFGAGPGPSGLMLLLGFLFWAAMIGVLILIIVEPVIGFGALVGFCILLKIIDSI